MPDQIEQADRELNELSYRLITKRRYREAIVLLRFGLYEMKKHGTDATKKAMVVNLANAEKLDGNKDEAEKILSNEDWSASTDRFNICVAAVRDDTQTVVKLMKPVVDANLLNISDLRDWPVFENLRSDPAFIETFEREFGQKIVTDRETPIPSPSGEPSIAEEEDEATPQTAPEGKTVH